MNSREVPSAAGFIIGAIIGGMTAQSFGMQGIGKTLIAIGSGMLGGFLADLIAKNYRK